MDKLRSKGYVSELDYNANKRDTIEVEQNFEAQHFFKLLLCCTSYLKPRGQKPRRLQENATNHSA